MEPVGDIEVLRPDGDDAKEVYAFFGLASYLSQTVEKGLLHLVALLRVRALQRHERPGTWDTLVLPLERRTLGQLLRLHEGDISPQLRGDLQSALGTRNDLIHRFFWERAEDFMSAKGRARMIEELRVTTDLFERVNSSLLSTVHSLLERYGIPRRAIEKEFQRLLREARNEDT